MMEEYLLMFLQPLALEINFLIRVNRALIKFKTNKMKKLFKFYLIIGMVQVMALLFSFCHGQNGNGEKFTWKTFSPDGHMYIGVDYYPEHWPRERWEIDIKLMKEAGFNVVRLAEFAWVLMEPSEGNFDFQWLDDVISILEKYDIKVILGTPTAVMPAWLARKYPETR